MVSYFAMEPGAMFPCSLSRHLSKHKVKILTVVWGFFFYSLVSVMSPILVFLLSYKLRISAKNASVQLLFLPKQTHNMLVFLGYEKF